MVDFNELLDRPGNTFEKPKPMPSGHYEGIITKNVLDSATVKRDGANVDVPVLEMHVRAVAPQDDVDPDALEAYGGLNERSVLRYTWWLDEEAVWRYIDFCVNALGMSEDAPLRQMIDDAINQSCIMDVVNVPDKSNPEVIYANIKKGGLAAI